MIVLATGDANRERFVRRLIGEPLSQYFLDLQLRHEARVTHRSQKKEVHSGGFANGCLDRCCTSTRASEHAFGGHAVRRLSAVRNGVPMHHIA